MLRLMKRFFPTPVNPIGIDFGSDSLRLTQVACENGEFRLVAAATTDVPSHARGSTAARLEFFAHAVRELLGQSGFRGRRAVLGLPGWSMFIQHLRLPRLGDEETRKLLPFETRGKIPIDPSQAILRHLVAGEVFSDQEPRNEVIVMAAPREFVNQLLDAAAKARLDVVGMSTEPTALVSCFSHIYRRKDDAITVTGYIDIGAASTRVTFAVGEQILFARSVPIGGDHFTRAVADELKISFDDAKMLRIQLAAACGSNGIGSSGSSGSSCSTSNSSSGGDSSSGTSSSGSTGNSNSTDNSSTASGSDPINRIDGGRRADSVNGMALTAPNAPSAPPSQVSSVETETTDTPRNDDNSFALLGAAIARRERRSPDPLQTREDPSQTRQDQPQAMQRPQQNISGPRHSREDASSPVSDRQRRVEQAILDVASRLIEELNLCRRYHESVFPNRPLQRLVFVGGEARQKQLCQVIARALRLAAQIGDPMVLLGRNCELGPESGVDVTQPQPGLALSLGLSMGPRTMARSAAA